jgi:hypothetical protein
MLFVAISGSVAESVRAALCGGGQGNAVVLLGAGLTGAQLIGRQHRQVCPSLVEQVGARRTRAEFALNIRVRPYPFGRYAPVGFGRVS